MHKSNYFGEKTGAQPIRKATRHASIAKLVLTPKQYGVHLGSVDIPGRHSSSPFSRPAFHTFTPGTGLTRAQAPATAGGETSPNPQLNFSRQKTSARPARCESSPEKAHSLRPRRPQLTTLPSSSSKLLNLSQNLSRPPSADPASPCALNHLRPIPFTRQLGRFLSHPFFCHRGKEKRSSAYSIHHRRIPTNLQRERMHSIARPASRLVHARLGTANISRWRTLATLPPPRHNLPLSSSSPSSRRFYSHLPPIFAPPPPKEEPKQASPTSTSSTTSSDPSTQSSDAATSSSSTAPDSSSTSTSSSSSTPDNDTTTSSSPSSSSSSSSPKPDTPKSQPPDDPLPDTATKIHTALPPALSEKLSHLMDTAQTRLLTASTTLNTLTGYSPIEEIKRQNSLLETRLAQAQDLVRTARTTYKTTNAKRATTQREVTTLLARKEMWSPTDLERFTQLYRQDHSLEQEVAAASEALTDAEHAEQALGQQLNAGILKRYHEEQIWSDRIRRASTWGTWGLMGVNVLLFIVLQFVAEPWKRRRLVRGVVEEEKAVLEGVTAELAGLKAALAQREAYEDAATADDVAAYMASTTAAATITTPVVAVEEETPLAATEATAAEEAEELLAAKVEEPAVQHEMEREVASALEVLEEQVPEAKSWREAWRELLSNPELLKAKIADLYSERRIDLRMRDASILALEGAAAGATFAAALALLLVRRT